MVLMASVFSRSDLSERNRVRCCPAPSKACFCPLAGGQDHYPSKPILVKYVFTGSGEVGAATPSVEAVFVPEEQSQEHHADYQPFALFHFFHHPCGIVNP
jgi:hypothetical protein